MSKAILIAYFSRAGNELPDYGVSNAVFTTLSVMYGCCIKCTR